MIIIYRYSEKAGLKLNVQNTKIMASSPMTSWEIDEETLETVSDFIFGGSKITADGDCSHQSKRRLLLGRKVMTNLNSILKSRDITLPTKVHLVKAVFPSSHVWMWDLDYKESWAQKNWCFWAVVLEKTLESPWTARRSNQSILKGNSPEYSLEGLILKLKLQYFGHLIVKNWLIWKDPDAGKDWGQEEKGTTEDEIIGWHHQLNGHEFLQALGVGDGQGTQGRVWHYWTTELG